MPIPTSMSAIYGYGRPLRPTIEFNYPNFSSTAGLTLVSTESVRENALFITTATNAEVGNAYRSTAIRYNRSFSFEWNFEFSGGSSPPADGFFLQWTTTNNTNGSAGGGVGYISTAINALLFKTFSNNDFTWFNNNSERINVKFQNFYRNLFYWADYDHSTSTMRIYFSTTNSKPASANFTLTNFTFDATNYFIGFGAATGGANENHILRSMKLSFS
jgi:hypothetical protein